jgi:hypothetical protein
MAKKNKTRLKGQKPTVHGFHQAEGGNDQNRKQQQRRLYRQQKQIIRKLEKKYADSADLENSSNLSQKPTNCEGNSDSDEIQQLKGAKSRIFISQQMIQGSFEESVAQRLLSALPPNKSKIIHTSFLTKQDFLRQSRKIRGQFKEIPYQSQKKDVEWLTLEEQREEICSLITLSQELMKFANYVSVIQFAFCLYSSMNDNLVAL